MLASLVVALFAVAIGMALIFGADRIREWNLRYEGPRWERPLRHWLRNHVVEKSSFIWGYRIVGIAWVATGLWLLYDTLRPH